MATYKRKAGGSWWVRFTVRGQLIRRSARTTDRSKAEEYETALRDRYWRQAQLRESAKTWREAVQRYKRESIWRPNTKKTNEFSLTFFERLNPIAVGAITADVVRAARDHVARSQRPASANRIMAVFRGVLRACVRWGWITHAPPVPMVHTPSKEIAVLDGSSAARLVAELPGHLKAPMMFSVLTGLRMSNVRDLDWSQVNLEQRRITIPASLYKTKRDHSLPLGAEAVKLLSGLPHRTGRVFLYDGRPITGTFNTRAFRNARRRAGLESVRWHDLRHTFASKLAAGGASDRVLQALGGWSSTRMVARYAHLRVEDLRSYADSVGTILGTSISAHDAESEDKPLKKLVPPV